MSTDDAFQILRDAAIALGTPSSSLGIQRNVGAADVFRAYVGPRHEAVGATPIEAARRVSEMVQRTIRAAR